MAGKPTRMYSYSLEYHLQDIMAKTDMGRKKLNVCETCSHATEGVAAMNDACCDYHETFCQTPPPHQTFAARVRIRSHLQKYFFLYPCKPPVSPHTHSTSPRIHHSLQQPPPCPQTPTTRPASKPSPTRPPEVKQKTSAWTDLLPTPAATARPM